MKTEIQTMPNNEFMIFAKDLSTHDYLNYYKNIWERNLVAKTIDVESDRIRKAIDPNEQVEYVKENQLFVIPVKERLEYRKDEIREVKAILEAINKMIATSKDEYEAKYLSADALKVDEDMKPAAEETPAAEEKSEPVDADIKETPAEETENHVDEKAADAVEETPQESADTAAETTETETESESEEKTNQ